MGELAKKFVKAENRRKDLGNKKRPLAPAEQKALRSIRREAKAAGSFLTSSGEGGLPPSTVLGLMRKARFRCKVCGELGTRDNGGIGLHHKYQHITAPKEREKGVRALEEGRRNDPSQLTVICKRCHDEIHQKDRAEFGGEDAEQELESK